MNNQTHSTVPQKLKGGSSALNIGIGMLIGLIVALVVAYFAMSSGPFRDKSNKNVLSDPKGNTDPNAPLYTSPSAAPTIPSNTAPGNEQGAGVSALTDSNPQVTTPGQPQTVPSTDANTSGSSTPLATPDKKPANVDSIGEIIVNKGKTTSSNSSGSNTNAATPKVVTPVTANTSGSASASSARYTIQAGNFDNANDAQALKDKLSSQGQTASISKKQTANGPVYRVRVGSYDNAKAAQEANRKVKGVVLDVSP
jgi:cell division protein FtsN